LSDLKPPEKTQFRRQESQLKVSETEMDLPTFPVLVRDWDRIHRRVSDLANPISWARDLAWSCVALGGACVLALIPWLPAYHALDRDSKLAFDWVTPALVIGAGACAVIAVISFVQHAKVDEVVRRDVSHVLEEMDEIHLPESGKGAAGTPPLNFARRLRELRARAR
jgi:hypothetical protein